MNDTGQIKQYTTDWLIFVKTEGNIMIFDNKNVKIISGKYVIPDNNLIKDIY